MQKPALKIVTSALQFPEGPVALADGSFLVVEVLAGRLTLVAPNGEVKTIVQLGGGPNGAAIGPDGRCYICNNGGITAAEIERLHSTLPESELKPGVPQGRIEVVDLHSGAWSVLYEQCDGEHLIAPNDLVFDAAGGFYFTDFGSLKVRAPQRSRVYYAQPDGSSIRCVIGGLERANGIGIAPDGRTLYVAETNSGSVWSFEIIGDGELNTSAATRCGGKLLYRNDERQFDSLAIDSEGCVCVATPYAGTIMRISPAGELLDEIWIAEQGTTNICFGGDGMHTAYVTASIDGQLIALQWSYAGLRLPFNT